MRLKVRVVPRSAKNAFMRREDGSYRARLNAPPVDGKANTALIDLVCESFKVKRSAVKIVSGHKSRDKIIEVLK